MNQSKRKLLLIGGGGHCKVILDILKYNNTYEIVGIYDDDTTKLGKRILGIEIKYSGYKDLIRLFKNGITDAFVAIGSVGDPDIRINFFKKLKKIGFNLPIIKSSRAVIAEDVKIGEGTVVMHGAIINPGTKIGKNVIINTGSIIDHDCTIHDHVHIAPGVTLSGGVKVGYATHVGTGASIIQNIHIGERTIIGAGSVVTKDIPNNVIAKGVPARWTKRR